jgi:hypothetical protein
MQRLLMAGLGMGSKMMGGGGMGGVPAMGGRQYGNFTGQKRR